MQVVVLLAFSRISPCPSNNFKWCSRPTTHNPPPGQTQLGISDPGCCSDFRPQIVIALVHAFSLRMPEICVSLAGVYPDVKDGNTFWCTPCTTVERPKPPHYSPIDCVLRLVSSPRSVITGPPEALRWPASYQSDPSVQCKLKHGASKAFYLAVVAECETVSKEGGTWQPKRRST